MHSCIWIFIRYKIYLSTRLFFLPLLPLIFPPKIELINELSKTIVSPIAHKPKATMMINMFHNFGFAGIDR